MGSIVGPLSSLKSFIGMEGTLLSPAFLFSLSLSDFRLILEEEEDG